LQLGERFVTRGRANLAGALERFEDHRVAGLDGKPRRERFVPKRMRLLVIEPVLAHAATE
jgi:hypothetical protein